MRTRKLLTILGGVCLALVLVALPFMASCAPEEEVTPTTPTTLTTPPPEEHWTVGMAVNSCAALDPGASYEGWDTHKVHLHVWEPLTGIEMFTKPDGTICMWEVPCLATGYEWVDVTHIKFKLREGVKFQNGEDFTAEDVKYSFDYMLQMPLGGVSLLIEHLEFFSECNILDPYIVEFVLKEPNIDAISHIQHLVILPKSRGLTEESVAAFNSNPVGTGPYKVKDFVVDQYWELEAWEDYRDGMARPKYLTIRYVPEPSSRFAGLLTGELDIIEAPAPEHLREIEKNPDLAVDTVKGCTEFLYILNWYKPPYNNPLVRQALNYAIDRSAIVDQILEGHGIPLPNFIYGTWTGAIAEMEPYPYDPERARQLLAEAGYADGFDCEIVCTSGETMKDLEIAQAIQAYLADVGIRATLSPVETPVRFGRYFEGDFEILLDYWEFSAHSPADPVKFYLRFYPFMVEAGGGVEAIPEDIAEIYTLWQEVVGEPDPTEQLAIFRQINQLTYDAATSVLLYGSDWVRPYNKAKMGKWEAICSYMVGYVRYYDYRALYPADRAIEWEWPYQGQFPAE